MVRVIRSLPEVVRMILCHCHVVSDRSVATAVGNGATTLAGVCRSTGAGRDCGACVFSVKKAMRVAEEAVAPLAGPLGHATTEVA